MIVTLIQNPMQSSPLSLSTQFSPFRGTASGGNRFRSIVFSILCAPFPFVRIFMIKFIWTKLYNIHKGMYRWKCIVKGKLDVDELSLMNCVAPVYNDPLSLIIPVTHYSTRFLLSLSRGRVFFPSPSIVPYAPFARIFMLRRNIWT